VLGIAGRPGAFAEYLTLPEANLHVVPEHLSAEEAVFIEPLAAAAQIFTQVRIAPADRVFLFGTGKLGLLVAMLLRLGGHDYRAFNRNPRKVAKARELGLRCDLLTELSPHAQADIAIDCTGNPEGLALALGHLRPRGTLILKTTVAAPPAVDVNNMVINEITVIGSRCGPFAPALKILASRTIDVRPLISEILPFARALETFKLADTGDYLKILLKF
jgi:threonine dehydrogenase-like Zn-dependent dehydrogenase